MRLLEEFDQAISCWKDSIALQPSSPDAHTSTFVLFSLRVLPPHIACKTLQAHTSSRQSADQTSRYTTYGTPLLRLSPLRLIPVSLTSAFIASRRPLRPKMVKLHLTLRLCSRHVGFLKSRWSSTRRAKSLALSGPPCTCATYVLYALR